MSWIVYLRSGTVYIPTKARPGNFGYLDIEPVEVAPVDDTQAFEQALKRTIERGNPRIPRPAPGELRSRSPVVLRYAKVKTWSSFAKSASGWSIEERDGIYTIAPYKQTQEQKGWVVDTERAETLPFGTTVEQVVRRTVERVQASEC
jgi:hypothetical protein